MAAGRQDLTMTTTKTTKKKKPSHRSVTVAVVPPTDTAALLAASVRDRKRKVQIDNYGRSKWGHVMRAIDELAPGSSMTFPGSRADIERMRNSLLVRAARHGGKKCTTRRIDGALLVIRIDVTTGDASPDTSHLKRF